MAAVGRVAVARPEAGDELMVEFTKEDYEVVSAAIREAEKRTSGQIVCVLAHSSSEYAYVPILWASVLALAAPWPLIEFTQWSVQRIFVMQLVVFILAGFLFSWMPLRLALVPRPIQRVRAHRAALEQFVVRRVTHTRNRSWHSHLRLDGGALRARHRGRRNCPEGASGGMASRHQFLTEHIRNGRIAAGFVAAIERCGAYLLRTRRPMVLPTSCQTACT